MGETVTATLEDLELVVQPFDKATSLQIDKIIGDGIPVTVQGLEKAIKTGQLTLANGCFPGPQGTFGIILEGRLFKNGGELFAEVISLFEQRTVGEQAVQDGTLVGIQIGS